MSDNPMASLFERYGEHLGAEGILRFVREMLLPPGEQLDLWQVQVLTEFGNGTRRMSIAACHGPGKTAVAAWCVVYSLIFRFPLKAVATAPSRGQLEGALMAEVVKWVEELPEPMKALLEVKAMSVHLRRRPRACSFEARTARPENPEALQGIHEDAGWVFILVDEASGVHEKIFESAIGSMSGKNCQTMLLSNPTRTSGFFFQTHHQNRDAWFTMSISHKDSARVTDEFVQEVADTYGRDSNMFRVRCLGLFPLADMDALIAYELVQGAQERDIHVPKNLRPVWGLDVARFGDDSTVLCKRNALTLLPDIKVWDQLDTMQVAGRVKHEWDETPDEQRPSVILVDVIGIGAGVVDRLLELGLPVRGINVAETAAMSDKYRNLRTELWFRAKDWLATKSVTLPLCEGDCRDRRMCPLHRLAAELTTIKYDLTSTGKLMAESKSDMKKRGYKSPDVADAFVLTFAEETSTLVHGSNDDWGYGAWNQPLSRNRSMV